MGEQKLRHRIFLSEPEQNNVKLISVVHRRNNKKKVSGTQWRLLNGYDIRIRETDAITLVRALRSPN